MFVMGGSIDVYIATNNITNKYSQFHVHVVCYAIILNKINVVYHYLYR